jgi:hypothetical protein
MGLQQQSYSIAQLIAPAKLPSKTSEVWPGLLNLMALTGE